MNQKTLIGLAIAALLALIAAVALNHTQKPVTESGEATAYLAPGLRDHLNDVDKIVVTGAGDKTIATLTRGKDGWGVAEKGGFPVDTGKLREFLFKLADAKQVEQKTANKDKYAALGVEDVSAKDAKGVQVELDGLAQPLKLIVGTPSTRGGGTYVRRAGDAQSWLASGSLTLEKNAADWLKKDLADIAADRVQSVTLEHADGTPVHVAKSAAGDANFVLADIPKGREAGAEYSINGPASALAGLRFDDVLPAKDAAPADKPLKARYALFDGLVIEATAWEQDGKDYAQFVASLDATQADKGIAAAQEKAKSEFEAASAAKPDAARDATAADTAKDKTTAAAPPIKPLALSDPVKDRENRMAALNRQVADLNAHFSGWTFVLPSYKYAAMNKSMDDMLKPLEAKKPAEGVKKSPKAKSPKK